MSTPSSTSSVSVDYDRIRRGGEYGFIGILLELIGSIVSLASRVGGMIVAIVGLIILLVSLHELSEELGEENIFKYGIYGLVVSIVGSVIIAVSFLGVLLHGFISLSFSSIIGAAIGAFIALYILLVIIGYIYKRIYEMLSEKTLTLNSEASQNFKSAAKWYWIGVLLVIIIVGAVLVIIGQIYALIAFNNLQHTMPSNTTSNTSMQTS